ncbi:MAG TPA: D-sedoheptulose 7-phosphate isomerase [Patescibacteria group bacterium]|nr:D-sedoheptulose 7-phosphate isomerase [Patescibacteria group bacterium]
MKETEIIRRSFENHSSLVDKTMDKHIGNIIRAAYLVMDCFANDGKLVFFGNGGSAADSQHMAAEFTGRFLLERRSLPAIALTTDTSILTAIGNDYGYEKIFERQVESMVKKGDVVFAISTSGNSENVVRGVLAAKNNGAKVVALTGNGGGRLGQYSDILIDIPSDETPRIQEMHLLTEHVICDLVEKSLF